MIRAMSERRPPPEIRYFCVDIEASGPVPALYNMLSLGCVAITPPAREGAPPTPGASLYLEIRPSFPGFDAGAMRVNGLDRTALERDGLPLKDALLRLTAFVDAHRPPGARAVFVGHNAPFDWSYVNFSYHHERLPNPFGYSALDTKAMAIGVLGLDWQDTNKETLERLLSLPAQDASQTHRADYDALYQAWIFCGLTARMSRAV